MESIYHDGEQAVQARAGVTRMAERIARGIHGEIPPPAAHFLSEARFAVVGAGRSDGSVWSTVVTGNPGFLDAVDPTRLLVATRPDEADPLAGIWLEGGEIGLLAIDFAARQRMRINGVARPVPGGLEISPTQVYANCPKHIRPRELSAATAGSGTETSVRASASLSADAQRLVTRSDTFFIATALSGSGADASHRGGPRGLVTVVDQRTLVWPDYAGNTMFQTLGNIESTGRAGLLFVDFDDGDLLHVSGTARVLWDDPRIAVHAGAERLIELSVSSVVERRAAFPLRFHDVEADERTEPCLR